MRTFVITVLLAVLALLAPRAADAQCNAIVNQTLCEADRSPTNATIKTCYWQTFAPPPACRELPTLNADCVCVSPPCSQLRFDGQPSGCQPTRYCRGADGVTKCLVTNPPENDAECVKNGDTNNCVPSEFCELAIPNLPSVSQCIIIRPPTPKPTRSPAPPTFEPTRVPTVFKEPEEEANVDVPLVAGGAVAGAVVFGVAAFAFFTVRRSKDKAALRGVITAEEYLEHAKPRVPRPPKRAALTGQQMEAQGMKLVVSFDFEGENDDELSVDQGTWLIGLVRYDEWWEARTADGEFGIIPISYVTEMGVTEGIVDAENLRAIDKVDF